MLLQSFFEVKEKSAVETGGKTVIAARIVINKMHPIFDGHFPNLPIVPGVCMVQIIKEMLEGHSNRKLFLTSASNIKFLSVINPKVNSEVSVEINSTTTPLTFDVDARLFWETVTFFKIRGNFSTSL